MRAVTMAGVLCVALCTPGCALHYFDADTGTEHLWGIGHMKMRAVPPREELKAVVHGTDAVGFGLGSAESHRYLIFGWQRLQFIEIVDKDASVRLEWPDASFLNVRVGSAFPGESPGESGRSQPNEKSEGEGGSQP